MDIIDCQGDKWNLISQKYYEKIDEYEMKYKHESSGKIYRVFVMTIDKSAIKQIIDELIKRER